ncbi:MAG: NADH-quinone oxidoreductase subunit NuoG, partial [Solimonas sp.]
MATIHVDGKQYEVDGADNLLQACLNLGLDIPYFCWHPALGSVGACRQCAVKAFRDETDKQGRIVMSCMTPASNGTFISIDDEEARQFREAIVEFLMTNHPHDCPVCEEGGHCHLQDMTVMTGHHSRSYRFDKRTHLNQDLGPFIGHEMNRCISCYRCVRYYKDYAGGNDLGVYGAAANVYFGRVEDGTLESEFSGNLTEVCPTGVFTDKTHSERYNRKWDMQYAPSVCESCAVGCNLSPGERYGEIRRVENRYHGELNGYFLCDRGRFGYGYTNRKDRPRQPLSAQQVVTRETAVAAAVAALKGANKVIGIGSPRASVEANYALRTLVGAGSFHDGHALGDGELVRLALGIVRDGPVRASTITEIEDADAVLVLGEDVTATAPRFALAIRQAARGKGRALAAEKKVAEWQTIALADLLQRDSYPVYVASVDATRLDDVAAATHRAAPEDLARLGHAIANAIDAGAPAVAGLDAATAALARTIAAALARA